MTADPVRGLPLAGYINGSKPWRIVTCKEFATSEVEPHRIVRVDGSVDVFKEIEKSGYLSFEVSSRGVQVRAGQFVGLIPVNSRLAIRVTPRIPLQNLTRMVTDLNLNLQALSALRYYGESPDLALWMTDVLTDAFIESVNGLREQGLERQYFRRNDASSTPRGRVSLAETARFWARGERHKAGFAWFERTPQSTYNEVLKAALLLCLSTYRDPAVRNSSGNRLRVSRLGAALHVFDEVQEPGAHKIRVLAEQVRRSPVPATLDHYRTPLGLASRLLLGRGIDLESDEGEALRTSLLVDMGDLFEKYVRKVLQEKVAQENWPWSVLDGNLASAKLPMYLEASPGDFALAPERTPPAKAGGLANSMTPDILIQGAGGVNLVVADVKNKPTKDMPKRDDVEQVLAYAVRYGVSRALLIYPKSAGQDTGLQAVGRIGYVSIFQYHYDLDTEDLDGSKALFSESVKRLVEN